jgi:hypothetical protein
VLREHKRRRIADKRNIMTVVLKRARAAHRTRTLDDHTFVALCPATKQLLAYENAPDDATTAVEVSRFEQHRKIQYRFE